MLTCVFVGSWNAPISLKLMIGESHPFLCLSLRNAPFTQRQTTKSRICAWYVNRISNEMIPLSLNGSMDIYEWSLQREHLHEKNSKNNSILWIGSWKRYPYYPNQPKNKPFSLICSDLSLTLKRAPFSVNSWTRMLTHIVNVVPPGRNP